ncbi:hypothetical protein COY17_02275, partial [Candidatus Saccharibacteria bacterium CG_4_10_14_0_2_um_filter_52_9]
MKRISKICNGIGLFLAIGVLGATLLTFILPQQATASPYCGDGTAPYGCPGKPYPKIGTIASAGDVSISGQYAVTNNPNSYFEVTDVNPGTISIKINYTCGAGQLGFRIYIREVGGSFGAAKVSQDAVCSSGTGSGTSNTANFPIPVGSIADGYNAAEVRVSAVNYGGNGGHLPFNIIVDGGTEPWISYSDQGSYKTVNPDVPSPRSAWFPQENPFGVWMSAVNIGFQAPCDLAYSDTVFLKWSGADDGASYQTINNDSSDMYTELFDYSTGESIWKSSYYPTLNGQNSTGPTNMIASKGVNLTKGHKYIWRWRNVSSNNEIALSIPFSQNSWGQDCTPPTPTNTAPTGTIYSLQCNYMKGAVRDPDNTGVALPYKIVKHQNSTGTDTTLNGTGAGTSAGGDDVPGWANHSFYYDHKFNRLTSDYTYYLYTQDWIPRTGKLDGGWHLVDQKSVTRDCTATDPPPVTSITGDCDVAHVYMQDDNSRGTLNYSIAVNPTDWDGQGGDGTWPGVLYKGVKTNATGENDAPFDVPLPHAPLGKGWRVMFAVNNVLPDGSKDEDWNHIKSTEYTTANCYQATCTAEVVGNVPNGPAGSVEADKDFDVRVTVTNVGPGTLWSTADDYNANGHNLSVTQPPNTDFGGRGYIEHDVGQDIPIGQSRTTPVRFRAPHARNTYNNIRFYPDYYGWGSIGDGCTATAKIYQRFTIDPREASTEDIQDPETIVYSNVSTKTSSSSDDVPASAETWLKRTRTNGTVQNLGGPNTTSHSYGTANDNYTYTQPPSEVQPGDKYCAYVTITYATGYYGPGGDIANGQAGTSPNDCFKVVNMPYTHFLGSDVSAGGGFKGSTGLCTTDHGG